MAMETEVNYRLYEVAILLLHMYKHYVIKSCIFFENVSPHKISLTYMKWYYINSNLRS
jgi:hypothetical protein